MSLEQVGYYFRASLIVFPVIIIIVPFISIAVIVMLISKALKIGCYSDDYEEPESYLDYSH